MPTTRPADERSAAQLRAEVDRSLIELAQRSARIRGATTIRREDVRLAEDTIGERLAIDVAKAVRPSFVHRPSDALSRPQPQIGT